MAAPKLALRLQHTGAFARDQEQRLAQQAAAKTNLHVDTLAVLANRGYIALAADTTLAGSAGVYTTLLSASVTTTLKNGFLIVTFTASGTHPTTANSTVYFKLFVDGVFVRGAYVTTGIAAAAFAAPILARVPVTAGSHVVRIDWSTDNNSARINANSNVNEHAALLAQEAA